MALERTNRPHGFIDVAPSQLGGPRTALLDAHGVHDGTIKHRFRGQAELPWWQQHINAFNAKTRAIVEHPLAWIKRMGHRRVRYPGLRRNALDFTLIAMASNFKRRLSLKPA